MSPVLKDSIVRRLLSALHWNSSNSVLRTRGRLALLLLLSDSSASSILRTSTSTSTSFPSVASRKSLRHVIASLPSSGCCSTSLPNPEVSCWPLSTRNVAIRASPTTVSSLFDGLNNSLPCPSTYDVLDTRHEINAVCVWGRTCTFNGEVGSIIFSHYSYLRERLDSGVGSV